MPARSENSLKIQELIDQLKDKKMSSDEAHEQLINSVYGNGNASSPEITLDTVRETSKKLYNK